MKKRIFTTSSRNSRFLSSLLVPILTVVLTRLRPSLTWTSSCRRRRHHHNLGSIRHRVDDDDYVSSIVLYAKKKRNARASGGGGSTGAGFGSGRSRTVAAGQQQQQQQRPTTTTTASSRRDKRLVTKRLVQKYGGTSSSDIAKGTQERIDVAMTSLPTHLQMACTLYQQLSKWNTKVRSMSVLDHSQVLPIELDTAQRLQDELDTIMLEYNISTYDIHNVYQKLTWDASADAKVANAMLSDFVLSKDVTTKVDRACRIVADTILHTIDIDGRSYNNITTTIVGRRRRGRVLDVGCGYGVLVPYLLQCGLSSTEIYGIDLSTEMIRNAQDRYRDVHFDVGDFLQYTPSSSKKNNDNDDDVFLFFDGIIFCSSIHDLPDIQRTLVKASSLVRSGGKIVIVHPRGAAHVAKQHTANPVMVRQPLPTSQDLRTMVTNEMNDDLLVEKYPAEPGSLLEQEEGYLAVLVKK